MFGLFELDCFFPISSGGLAVLEEASELGLTVLENSIAFNARLAVGENGGGWSNCSEALTTEIFGLLLAVTEEWCWSKWRRFRELFVPISSKN